MAGVRQRDRQTDTDTDTDIMNKAQDKKKRESL